ncbi:hypothetical protein PTKIN_Ptkin09bG0170200 [Pterospermum kingtungense]
MKNNTEEREGCCWVVAKLLTNRSFNKDAILNTLRVVWRLSKEAEALVLDVNLFLFKFATWRDKQRIFEGAPLFFDKHFLLFREYNGELRLIDYTFNKACF